MVNALSKIDIAIASMTDEELAYCEGGLGWAAVLAVGAYVAILNEAWELGEKIGDAITR